jgi:hypothetical protein
MCAGGTGTVECQIGGVPNTPGYTYIWNNGSQTPTQTGMAAGVYTVVVTDNVTGCDTTLVLTLTEPAPITATVSVTPDFGNSDGSAALAFSGGTSPYSFTYAPLLGQAIGNTITMLPAATYWVWITDANACVDSFPFTIPYATAVFPGDCNHDQVANMQDLLPIGVKYGSTGPLRPNASLAWTPQVAPLWGDTLANGRDIRHVDTDGNGVINDDDTLAINLNFGMTHNNMRPTAASGVSLSFLMPTMNLVPGDTIVVPIVLGTVDTPAVNLYGMAFSITYDSSKVEENGFHIDFSNSWLGTTGTNMIAMYRDDYAAGRVDIALVRTNQMNQSGFGAIAEAIIVIDDHVAKRDVPLALDFADIFAIDVEEAEIPVQGVPGVATITTGFSSFPDAQFQVYPNPASDFVEIAHSGLQQGNVTLLDMQGRIVSQTLINPAGKTRIEVQDLAKGIYMIQVESDGRVFVEKVSVR